QALEDEYLLRRARPDADFFALQILDRGNRRILRGNYRHALVAGRSDDDDRLAGGGAQSGGCDAEHTEIDRLGDNRVLAFGRALEWDHLDLVAGRRELLVEIRRDRMDEFERAHLEDGSISTYDAGTGNGSRGRTNQEFSTADHDALPLLSEEKQQGPCHWYSLIVPKALYRACIESGQPDVKNGSRCVDIRLQLAKTHRPQCATRRRRKMLWRRKLRSHRHRRGRET